ncbi:MAG: glutamate--tRNA ligase [Calditrichaeota bacterium]|nr:glutamate--tRNA ligase [Calditrichota bacterium]MCB9366037.1 glutamate--tRNA ligase [Calditrichota bacterium]MCB9391837.1 glutamate--tRNA ligase [Calditrichota bacterium]
MTDLRVRFAPSPTGYLHVGGARTAIFNWLYARACGGTFVVRIEDTDPQRSRGELAQVILDGLKWLGLESDEEIVYQSDHKERFVEVAHELVRRGFAYHDFTTVEELEQMRKDSQARGEASFRFKADLATVREDADLRLKNGDPCAIRFSAPPDGIAWNDLVHGPVEYKGDELEDFVLLRSDGSPTYHLSVVCDDHDMRISHILRGDDHISNTPKQIALYRAMEWEVPQFGHVPLILGPDRKRLSKRTGAASVGEFQQKGFLPQALFNFLTLLGWSPGKGDRELFSREELIEVFTLDGIQTKSAVFDEAKLEWMNGEHIRMLSDDDAVSYLREHSGPLSVSDSTLRSAWPLVKPRIRLPKDLFEDQNYVFTDPLDYDPKGVEKHLATPEILKHLSSFAADLETVTFSPESLEEKLRARCDEWEIKAGQLIHPIRLALTGKTVSPGLFEMMELLGRETVLRRINRLLKVHLAS